MTEVYFRGEWVDKSLVNLWLNNPENQRILEEEQAKEKAQAEEERKKLQQQKRAESRLREKKAAEYFHKYRQELQVQLGSDQNHNVEISDEYARILWQRAYNDVEYDRKYEEDRKRQEEEQRIMAQQEKERREHKEQEARQRAEYEKKLPGIQLQRILSGDLHKCTGCSRRLHIRPGINLLSEDVLDWETYNMIKEHARDGESPKDAIKRVFLASAAVGKGKKEKVATAAAN